MKLFRNKAIRFVAEVRPIENHNRGMVEVSLSKKATISAEGNVSTKKLAEAIKTTAESISVDQYQTPNQIKQIETPKKTSFWTKLSRFAMPAIAFTSLIIIGATIWFWKSSDSSKSKPPNPLSNVTILNTNLERLTNAGNAWNPSVSPDNKQIAYVFHNNNKDSIRLKNLATGSVTEVVSPTDAYFGQPIFTTDGNYLLYPSRDGGNESSLYKIPIYGGSQQKLLQMPVAILLFLAMENGFRSYVTMEKLMNIV